MRELALVMILAVAGLKVIPTQLVLELAIVSESLLDFLIAVSAEMSKLGYHRRLVVADCYH